MLEEYFVPVAIYNNTGGKDQKVLKQFGEPAWNYQVMRFIDTDLKDIIPRKDRVWDVRGTVNRLTEALKASSTPMPAYVENVLIPERSETNKIAAFAMYCFWTGEAKLGSLDGVIATEAGFYDGHEVVVVKYDEEKIDLLSLVAEAEKFDCASAVYLPTSEDQALVKDKTRLTNVKQFSFKNGYRKAPESDQKRQLSSNKAKLRELGLSPMQWTKLNSSRVSGGSVSNWLSPRQIGLLKSR